MTVLTPYEPASMVRLVSDQLLFVRDARLLSQHFDAAHGTLTGDPVGFAPIENCPPAIVNVDCTDLIDGHSQWKAHLAEVLLRADAVASNAQPTAPETISHPESGSRARWTGKAAIVALIAAVASVLGLMAMLR